MLILRAVLLAVEAITCILLVVIILLQKSRSEGLGLAFGAGMGEALFGSRAGNVLTRMTIILTIVFLANTLVLALLYSGGRGRVLMGGYGVMPAAEQPARQPRPEAGAQAPAGAPAAPAGGIPTLPGANLGDQPVPAQAPAAPAPAEEEKP